MKSFRDITQQFEKDLKDNGITVFIVAVKNPDGEDMYWHSGSDIFWQIGASQMISDRMREMCTDIHHESDEDDYDQ